MICQMCGKGEASFHISSNINGCVTETHLCPECAANSGYDLGQVCDLGGVFDGIFPVPGGIEWFSHLSMPAIAVPVQRVDPAYQFPAAPPAGVSESGYCGDSVCGSNTADTYAAAIDDNMKKRRELNVQMSAAIEQEDFEKAAELRDKIKELEKP